MLSGKKRNGGVNTIIIETLREYDDKIPIDFLAKKIGRERNEITKYLEDLETKGILHNDGNYVYITH